MEVTVDVRCSDGDSHGSAAEGGQNGEREWKGVEASPLLSLEALRLDVNYVAYGPMGRVSASQHTILPLRFPCPPLEGSSSSSSSSNEGTGRIAVEHQQHRYQREQEPQQPAWREVAEGVLVLPVRTHLLCHLDDPVAVIQRYGAQEAPRPGAPGSALAIHIECAWSSAYPTPLLHHAGRCPRPENLRLRLGCAGVFRLQCSCGFSSVCCSS